MNFVNRRQIVIEWGHCDPANMVFGSGYFEFADWSTALLFEAAFGMRITEIKAKYEADMPLVGIGGRVVKPLIMDDLVEIASKIDAFKRSSFVVLHEFFNHGELAAEVRETRVWVAVDPGEPAKLRSKPIPAEVTERFRSA